MDIFHGCLFFFGWNLLLKGTAAQVATLSPTSPNVTQYSRLTFTCQTKSTNTEYVVWNKRIGSTDLAIGTITIKGDNDCSPPFASLEPNPTLYSYACPATNRLTLTIRNVSRTDNGYRWRCTVQVDGTRTNSNEETITVQVGITDVTLSPATDPINVIENIETTLQCRTSGGLPAASVKWFIQRSGQVQDVTSLSTNTYQEEDNLNVTQSTLNYTPVKADQSGQIYCSANNVGVERNSTKPSINVFYGPERPLCKTNNLNITSVLKVIIGTTFTISCTVDSNPAPYSYLWSRSGGSSQQLGFTNIQRIQGGEYTLQVFNRMNVSGSSSPVDGSNTTSFTVDVLFPPAVPSIRMNGKEVTGTVKVIEGNSKTFNCSTESNPVSSYSWTYQRGSSSNNILQVNKFQSGSYDGDYTCQVVYRMEPSFGDSKENVSQATISVDVLYGPKTGNLQNLSKVRGEDFVYQCLYTPGNPTNVDFEWTKSGTDVSWVKQNTQNLTIPNVQRSNEASYTCKVSTLLQPTLTTATTTQYDTATFYLNILYGAENLVLQLNNVSNASVEIDEHSSNQMRCFLESDPGSNMTLTKDGKTIIARSGIHQLSQVIQAECSDAGVYTCSGYNQYGAADNASMHLFVKCSARRPPGVEVQLNFTARQHENATLIYNIVAYPVPKPQEFVWKRCTNRTSCEPFPDNMRRIKINTEGLLSKLSVIDVQIEDYRLYQLAVSNGIGDTLVEWLHLRPIGKPDLPKNFHVIQDTIGETSAVLTWTPAFDNGSPQKFHISYGKLVDDTKYITHTVKHDKRKEMNYTVENLEPGTEYFVSLFAANEEGSTASVNDTFLTLTRLIPETQDGPTAAIIGGATGGGIVAIIIIVGVVVFVIRLRQPGDLKDKETLTENRRMNPLSKQQQEEDDELPDIVENSMYVPAGDIPKRKQKEIKTASEDLYAQPKKAKTARPINSDIYAEVKKGNKNGTSKTNPKKQYDNKGFEDQTYENHDIQKTKKNVNKDGLIYADLEFAKPPRGQKKLFIHGLDDMTVYADVDLTKQADPLPDSDDDTPNKKENT